MVNREWWLNMKEGNHGDYIRSWTSFDNPPNFGDFEEIEIVRVLKEVGEEANDEEVADDEAEPGDD
jgi:hypothetical protein